MHDLLNRHIRVSESATQAGSNGPVVFTSTGDKVVMTPANPISIVRYGVIWTVAKDASALVLTLATRPTAGSDTARAVNDTMTDSATARLAGTIIERNIKGTNPNNSTGSDGSTVNVGPLAGNSGQAVEGVLILPGQEAVFAVTTASASTGQGYLYFDYIEYAPGTQGVYQNTGTNFTRVQL